MIIVAVIIISGTFLISYALLLSKKEKEHILFLDEFRSISTVYDAGVLDVHKEKLKDPKGKDREIPVVILQFRIEDQKKTVVHRMREKFYKSYSRGDNVKIYFHEQMPSDRALIDGDNLYEHTCALKKKYFIPLLITGIISLAAGIIMLFIR